MRRPKPGSMGGSTEVHPCHGLLRPLHRRPLQGPAACKAARIAERHASPGTMRYILELARPEGLEPPTPRFEAWYSVQLSYGRLRGRREVRCRNVPAKCTRRRGVPVREEPSGADPVSWTLRNFGGARTSAATHAGRTRGRFRRRRDGSSGPGLVEPPSMRSRPCSAKPGTNRATSCRGCDAARPPPFAPRTRYPFNPPSRTSRAGTESRA